MACRLGCQRCHQRAQPLPLRIEVTAVARSDRGLEDGIHLVRPTQTHRQFGLTQPGAGVPQKFVAGAARGRRVEKCPALELARGMPALRPDDQDDVAAALRYLATQHLDDILRGVSADWTADAAGGTDAHRFGDPAGGIVARDDQDAGSRDGVDAPLDHATCVSDRAACGLRRQVDRVHEVVPAIDDFAYADDHRATRFYRHRHPSGQRG